MTEKRWESDRRNFVKMTVTALGLASCLPPRWVAAMSQERSYAQPKDSHLRWTNVREIYADGRHNAWPDICRWRDRYYAVFNSGGKHHGTGHGMCLLSSPDGEKWEVVLLTREDEWGVMPDTTRPTLCPKLLPTKDRLIVVFYFYTPGDMSVSSKEKDELKRRWLELNGSEESFQCWVGHHETSYHSGLSYSEDGHTFRDPVEIHEHGWRVWRPQTFQGRHYMVGYRCHGQSWSITPELAQMIPQADSVEMFESASLFTSVDGLKWDKVSDIAAEDNDETDFDFTAEGRILAVSRKGASSKIRAGAEPGTRHALAYVSDPPYHSWRKLPLSEMIQAPAVRRVGNRWIVAGRYIDGKSQWPHPESPKPEHAGQRFGTRMWFLDDRTGTLTQAVTLPSWGDCSYPGILPAPDGDLLVIYYSHSITVDEHLYMGGGLWPGKIAPCSIYLARVVTTERA